MTAHPRSRGEHGPGGKVSVSDCGSSPLARGTLAAGHLSVQRKRLIPARAGNTGGVYASSRATAAHPRSRGEHTRTLDPPRPGGGSSPLARGTHRCHLGGGNLLRLIPARAGNTYVDITEWNAGSAHPRSRGEHGLSGSPFSSFRGSSPLARGTQFDAWEMLLADRLIPARAGNTCLRCHEDR